MHTTWTAHRAGHRAETVELRVRVAVTSRKPVILVQSESYMASFPNGASYFRRAYTVAWRLKGHGQVGPGTEERRQSQRKVAGGPGPAHNAVVLLHNIFYP